jgi:hypothetical protein
MDEIKKQRAVIQTGNVGTDYNDECSFWCTGILARDRMQRHRAVILSLSPDCPLRKAYDISQNDPDVNILLGSEEFALYRYPPTDLCLEHTPMTVHRRNHGNNGKLLAYAYGPHELESLLNPTFFTHLREPDDKDVEQLKQLLHQLSSSTKK